MSVAAAQSSTYSVPPKPSDDSSFIPRLYSGGTAVYDPKSIDDAHRTFARNFYQEGSLLTKASLSPFGLRGNEGRIWGTESEIIKMQPRHIYMGTSTLNEYESYEILTRLEQQGYKLTGLSALRSILVEYHFLLSLLMEAKDQLMEFYPTAVFRLQSMTLSDDTGGIQLIVELSGDVDASYDLLEQFDEAWWLPNLDRARGRVSVILDFA